LHGPASDIHQHLWPEELISALSRRRTPPLIRRRGSHLVLQLVGEPEYRIDTAEHDPEWRRRRSAALGIDLSVISLSGPLGIDWLPGDEGQELVDSYNEGVLRLGEGFASWGSIPVLSPDPARVDRLIDDGHVGISLPAAAISSRQGLDQLRPVLDRLEDRSAPLFVHPGPVYAADRFGTGREEPEWWAALTGYVDQMNRAWHAFVELGRARHPELRVAFAMLAGGAPLHGERLGARGGPQVSDDPNLFYDVSSYGPRGVDAALRAVGVDQLLFGTDLPVVGQPPLTGLGEAATAAISVTNPGRLLDRIASRAVAA